MLTQGGARRAPGPLQRHAHRGFFLSSWPLKDLEDELVLSPLPSQQPENPIQINNCQCSPRSWPLADLDEDLPSPELPANPFASAGQFPHRAPSTSSEPRELQQLITENTEAWSCGTPNTRLLFPTGEPNTHAPLPRFGIHHTLDHHMAASVVTTSMNMGFTFSWDQMQCASHGSLRIVIGGCLLHSRVLIRCCLAIQVDDGCLANIRAGCRQRPDQLLNQQ